MSHKCIIIQLWSIILWWEKKGRLIIENDYSDDSDNKILVMNKWWESKFSSFPFLCDYDKETVGIRQWHLTTNQDDNQQLALLIKHLATIRIKDK